LSQTPIFPTSLELFKLVRMIIDQDNAEEKPRDVEIGRMVGLESARTSRWKHGQISVNDAPRMLALSHNLGIDLNILAQVAAGYITSDDALEILGNEREFVRFLSENIMLGADGHTLSFVGGDGSTARVVRRTSDKYERLFKRATAANKTTGKIKDVVVLLVDDDDSTCDVFLNLTGKGTGIDGIVTRSLPKALIAAGQLQPRLVIIDLFLGQADGFAAIRALTSHNATGVTEVIATSRSLSPDIVRTALGSGASQVLQRPLRSRPLGKLLRDLRRGE